MSELQQSQIDRSREAEAVRRGHALLIEFLQDHDAACPICAYNVRKLTQPTCPECRQELTLTVGAANLRLGWLLLALVPGFFCGIAACLLAIPTTAVVFEDGIVVWPFVGAVIFGWCSGLFTLIFAFGGRGRNCNRFLARPRGMQRGIVILIWLIHFVALGAFFAWMASQI